MRRKAAATGLVGVVDLEDREFVLAGFSAVRSRPNRREVQDRVGGPATHVPLGRIPSKLS